MKKANEEKRLHPRLNHQLPIKVVANGYDFSTSTYNVSCVGTYCHIEKYVPPFTRVMIKLALPVTSEGSSKNYCPVECKGVIVRTDDENKGGFNIAIFFNQIRDDQRKKIAQYVNQFLP